MGGLGPLETLDTATSIDASTGGVAIANGGAGGVDAQPETTMNATETLVCGNQVQHDSSGVGHGWRNINALDIPANIREEIEGEMIDGGKETCEKFVGSNGMHYRW